MIGFGFVDFALIAFHFQKTGAMAVSWIPISYAVAMGTGAIGNVCWDACLTNEASGFSSSLPFGSFFTPLVFFGRSALAMLGMVIWGINTGAQDTLLKPTIADLISSGRRTTAFGIFDASFGAAWLVGSVAFGLLYGKSLPMLVLVSVVGQVASRPIFFFARNAEPAIPAPTVAAASIRCAWYLSDRLACVYAPSSWHGQRNTLGPRHGRRRPHPAHYLNGSSRWVCWTLQATCLKLTERILCFWVSFRSMGNQQYRVFKYAAIDHGTANDSRGNAAHC